MLTAYVNGADYHRDEHLVISRDEGHRLAVSRYHRPSVEEDEVPTQFLLSRLSSLIDYALDESTTLAEVCEHLVTDTLVASDCRQVAVRRVCEGGSIQTVASFGTGSAALAGYGQILNVSGGLASLAIEAGALVSIDFEILAASKRQPGKGDCVEVSNVIAYPLDGCHVLEMAFGPEPPISPQIRMLMGVVGSVVAANLRSRGEATNPVSSGPDVERARSLTERQLQILAMMTEGLSNFQIAQRIDYSDSTVRQETMRIYSALGFKNRGEAIAWYRDALRLSQ